MAKMDELIQKMSLEEKIGQVMAVGFDGLEPEPGLIELIEKYHLGGVIIFSRNVGSPSQVRELTSRLQSAARASGHPGLMVAVDQEGGRVARLTEDKGFTEFPGAMAMGASGSPENARRIALAMALEMKTVGINVDYAPVLDVNNNPFNPIISHRSFGGDPDRVAAFGIAFMRGLMDGGVMPFGKHFPGHGDTSVDSHVGLPVVAHDMLHLQQVELNPFRAAIQAGIPGIMTAHINFPAVEPDGLPATLSARVLTGLLRTELNFDGLIVTDSLEMRALAAKGYPPDLAGAMALKAGADQLLFNRDHDLHQNAFDRVRQWMKDGRIPAARLDEAVRRVLTAKERLGLLAGPEVDLGDLPGAELLEEHRALSLEVARQAVTLIGTDIPLLARDLSRSLILEPPQAAGVGKMAGIPTMQIAEQPSMEDVYQILQAVRGKTNIVQITADLAQSPGHELLARDLAAAHPQFLAAAVRSPYDYLAAPDVKRWLLTYGSQPFSLQALAEVLAGKQKAGGQLPFSR
jgi:beta-N-acetylhexosaminidase